MKTDPDYQAFPTPHLRMLDGSIEWGQSGLTKREEFAKAALQGILADPSDIACVPGCSCGESAAVLAVRHADNLIKALNGEIPVATLTVTSLP